jgi:hypothetical protein
MRRHHVEYRRRRDERQHTRVPLHIVITNRICQRIAFQVAVFVSPLGSRRNLTSICRSSEELHQQRIGLQRDL